MKGKKQVIFTIRESSMPQIEPDEVIIEYKGFDTAYVWQMQSALRMIMDECMNERIRLRK